MKEEKLPIDGKPLDSKPIDGKHIDQNFIDSPEAVKHRWDHKNMREKKQ